MEQFEKFYNQALRFLSLRPRSEQEVRTNLRGKHAPLTISNQIIEKLKEKNYINDEEFVKWWIEQRTRFRPRGIRIIKIELRQKGISPDLIEQVIQQKDFPVNNEKEQLVRLIQKKMQRYKGLSNQEIKQKLFRYLSSKGFDYDSIKDSIQQVV